MVKKRVLYLGDTSLQTAAAYLAGVMDYHNIAFDYCDSATAFSDDFLQKNYDLFILSDYAAKQFSTAHLDTLIEMCKKGETAIWMIGGWETHVGLGGDWHTTPLAAHLPLQMQDSDDRVNSYSPCMIRAESEHVIVKDLPFNSQTAAINGYNTLSLKEGAELLLSLKRYSASWNADDCVFKEVNSAPLLAVSALGAGRIASYAGDVAPHWAGGFVDWGDQRHALQAEGAGDVEIGNWYIQFFGNVVKWLIQDI